MKTKHIFLALVACVAALASCKREKPVFGIETDVEAVAFTMDGGTKTFQVITGQNWKVTKPATATWLNISPESGSGTATISLTTLPNNDRKKSAIIKVSAGMAGSVNVTVTEEGAIASGDGLSLATAWTPSEAKEWILANLPKETTGSSLVGSGAQKYWIKGVIHKIGTYQSVDQYFKSNDYGNASFYIADNTSETANDVSCYQVNYLGNKAYDKNSTDPDVKVGDEVVIYGPVANFNGVANTLGKGAAFMFSLNGTDRGGAVTEETDPTGDGSLENPFNAAGAVQYIKSAAYDANAKKYVRGVISDREKVEGEFKANSGTAIFSISEDGADYKTQFKCYGVYYLGNNPWIEGYSNVKPGDQVIVYGKLTFYQASAIYETADKEAYIYSLNGKTEPEPAFFVPKTAYTVRAADTEAEIDVLGSVAWTASVTGGATLAEPAGGNGTGNGKVKITFPANTSKDHNNVFTVTIATEDAAVTTAKSYAVAVTQNKDVDGKEVIFNYDNTTTMTTSQAAQSSTIDGVTMAITSGAKNATNKEIRVYKNSTMTISVAGSARIQQIVITASTAASDASAHLCDQFGAGLPEGCTVSEDKITATWTGSAASVPFTASGAQVRITQVSVVYIP